MNKDLAAWIKYTKAELFAEYDKKEEAIKLIKEIDYVPPGEFEIRKELVELKIGMYSGDDELKRYQNILGKSENSPELKWEIYAAMARHYEEMKRHEDAFAAYQNAHQILEAIAANLPIAYRDSYKSQRFRLKIVQKFSPDFTPKEILPEIRDLKVLDAKTAELKT